MQHFSSDNYAGICPEALLALTEANNGHAQAYGDDQWTKELCATIRAVFACDCDVYCVFNGTAANSLALAALCYGYEGVLCHRLAHIATDECGAPALFASGLNLLPQDGEMGKLSPHTLAPLLIAHTDTHRPRVRAVSLTQTSELGTVYRPSEIAAISALAHQHNAYVHMDGARFANAVASLKVSPAELSCRAGVDVLCLGGTKMGLAIGELIIFFNKSLSEGFAWRCKQAGQIASKMRFLAAPWLGALKNDNWLRYATHANAMAQRLSDGLSNIKGVKQLFPNEANAVFVHMPVALQSALRSRSWRFYNFLGEENVRLMCSWDTLPTSVDAFLADMRALS